MFQCLSKIMGVMEKAWSELKLALKILGKEKYLFYFRCWEVLQFFCWAKHEKLDLTSNCKMRSSGSSFSSEKFELEKKQE